jgi:hypothetical protein
MAEIFEESIISGLKTELLWAMPILKDVIHCIRRDFRVIGIFIRIILVFYMI